MASLSVFGKSERWKKKIRTSFSLHVTSTIASRFLEIFNGGITRYYNAFSCKMKNRAA
jgi:hypothetical protein